ncbi:MAG: Coenzyme F420 hydrogenase/dehydrogenase, beta subunit C-terminal domain [Candidatus Lokiarchaeota archaeon]|nr:Coenzyme F420 hydrogenase/dehydrogenase, beta subunit C-terminal domain [Candidatus Lokiarchaeota archaeon]
MDVGKPYKATPKAKLPPIEALLKTMLEEKLVDKVLGAKVDKDVTQVKPEAIDKAENVKDMNMPAYVAFNFSKMDSASKFLHKSMGGALNSKVGMFARPCDMRALVELHKRRQVNLDNLITIGIEEYGQVEQKSLKKYFTDKKIDPTKISSVRITSPEKVEMVIDGKSQVFPFDATLQICRNCSNCRNKLVRNADIKASFLSGDVILTPVTKKGLDAMEKAGKLLDYAESSFDGEALLKEMEAKGKAKQLQEIAEFRKKTPEQKMAALGSCTACGICIRACPVCFCVDCILMAKRKAKKIDQYTFQLSRIAHIADTCVQCGKCDSNCPKALPLNIYFNDIAMQLEEKYGYVSGRSIDDVPPRANVTDMRARYKRH